MEGYIITEGQAKALEKTTFGKNQYFQVVRDINVKPFIFEEEMKHLVMNNAFKNAMKTEYVAPVVTDGLE